MTLMILNSVLGGESGKKVIHFDAGTFTREFLTTPSTAIFVLRNSPYYIAWQGNLPRLGNGYKAVAGYYNYGSTAGGKYFGYIQWSDYSSTEPMTSLYMKFYRSNYSMLGYGGRSIANYSLDVYDL